MSKLSLFFIGIFIILLAAVYYPWFINANIIGGDWPYFFNETLKQFTLFPPAWSSLHGNGLGGVIPGYFLDQYLYFTAFLSSNVLHISWEVGYKTFWFGLFLILSVFSSMFLVKTVFFQAKFWQMALAATIFTTNTYILMVVGGGQMGVALAYSIAPLVLGMFIKVINHSRFSNQIFNFQFSIFNSVLAGLVLGVQIMFDPRITFITMTAIVLFGLINLKNFIKIKSLILFTFVIPCIIAVLLHASWIAPLLLFRHNPIEDLGSAVPTIEGLRFFSFASFSQTLSLLHPNWPENIFGKTYFMRSEFILLPIIAYSSLLFLSYKSLKHAEQNAERRGILFFTLLGLLGAFLAKGANPPFGEINIWMFEYIPGFAIFRDPTKYYVLVALSYSILIPFSITKIYLFLGSLRKFSIFNFQFSIKSKKSIFNFYNIFLVFGVLYLLFLIRPVFLGEMGGTFRKHEIPKEYVGLKDFLNSQHQFFRTFWIPRRQRFTFVSNIHPAIEAMPLFEATNSAQIVSGLQGSESQRLLEELSVRYVIIPYDSIGEIFLRDRKYDEKQRIDLEKQLDNIGWLKKIKTGKISVYETYSHRDHFWLDKGEISYKMVSPTRYLAEISTSTSHSLTFSENYSPYWTARIGEEYVTSKKTKDGLNSFAFNKVGKYNVEISYVQEKYFYYGRLVSFSTVIVLIILLIGIRRRFSSKN